MDSSTSSSFKSTLQILAVLCVFVFWSMILHKGYTGISALAQKYSGEEFWLALARYLLQNLAG